MNVRRKIVAARKRIQFVPARSDEIVGISKQNSDFGNKNLLLLVFNLEDIYFHTV
jgi:hypothetical protein